jgi:signal peptidase I
MTYAPEEPAGDAAPAEEPGKRSGLGCLLEIVETLVLTLIIYLLIHNFIAQPFEVEQTSMEPTIDPHEYVLIDKLTPRFGEFARGDIVVFQPPTGYEQDGVPFIKRVIGLPGDTVTLRNGDVFVTPPNGVAVRLQEPYIARRADGSGEPTQPKDAQGTEEWVVPPGTYFVLGDHRSVSQDSRFFGPIERDLIVGRAWLRYFPLDRIGFIDRPTYAGLPADRADTTARRLESPIAYGRGGSSATIQLSTARS